MSELLTAYETAEILQISLVTISNWMKRGLLTSCCPPRRLFDSEAVETLRLDIASGKIPRLGMRANKRYATRFRSLKSNPNCSNPEAQHQLQLLRKLMLEANLPVEWILFIQALRLLANAHEWKADTPRCTTLANAQYWRRKNVWQFMHSWRYALPEPEPPPAIFQKIFELNLILPEPDPLGYLYQTLQRSGKSIQSGSYYTPTAVVTQMLQGLEPQSPQDTLLDPGCGSGQFLLQAIQLGWKLPQLYGIDQDPIAIRLAGINLLLASPDATSSPQLKVADSLLEHPFRRHQFHTVVGNPPWGRITTGSYRKIIEKHYNPKISASEVFACFLMRATQLTRPGGKIRFLLPEAILNIQRYAEIRHQLLETCSWNQITEFGKKFHGVYTNVIALELANQPPTPKQQITIQPLNRKTYQVAQLSLVNNSELTLDTDPLVQSAWGKLLKRPHRLLSECSPQWALGIVTGDNHTFLLPVNAPQGEPIIRGSNVKPYRITPPQQKIRFEPKLLQQYAPQKLYHAPEKLVYRFIANTLVFALDRSQNLTLNSANCLIVPPPQYPMWLIAILFNSRIYRASFQNRFHTNKILKSHLETLPLPDFPPEVLQQLQTLAIPLFEADAPANVEKIEEILAKHIGLTDAEIQRINSLG